MDNNEHIRNSAEALRVLEEAKNIIDNSDPTEKFVSANVAIAAGSICTAMGLLGELLPANSIWLSGLREFRNILVPGIGITTASAAYRFGLAMKYRRINPN